MDQRAALHSLVTRHQGPRPYGRPVKAIPAKIRRSMHPQEAFRATLSECLAQLTANAATLRTGRSVEGLHQLRIAFRRLEVTLGAFGREFEQEWLEELRGRAKILSGRLAGARDLDVFVGSLLDGALAAQGPVMPAAGADALRAAATAQRDTAWAAATSCIASADFARFLDDVAALAQSRLPLGHARKLTGTARRMLRRQAARVEKRGRAAQSREEADLHRLRIALKKLRYTAEFFAPLFPAPKVKAYLACVRQLQEELGHLNDVAHVRQVIGTLLKEQTDGDIRLASGMVLGWYGASTPRTVKKTMKRYGRFRRLKPFWA
ncbi:MAG: CHAD domain-containing protein [Alphaproteobacteria bacterium]|nr:CHAD domain-containing protein [Alphaproteobacteria bacterium]